MVDAIGSNRSQVVAKTAKIGETKVADLSGKLAWFQTSGMDKVKSGTGLANLVKARERYSAIQTQIQSEIMQNGIKKFSTEG